MDEEVSNLEIPFQAGQWLRKEAEKKNFVVVGWVPSASALGSWTMVLYKENLPDLHLSINLSLAELTESTPERLMTSVLPKRWEDFLRSYHLVRRKHLRRLREGKEGLKLSQENSSPSDGSQTEESSNDFGPY